MYTCKEVQIRRQKQPNIKKQKSNQLACSGNWKALQLNHFQQKSKEKHVVYQVQLAHQP